MALDVSALIDILKRQNFLIKELIVLSDEELAILKEDDQDALNKLTKKQEEKGKSLALLEKERQETVLKYAKELDRDLPKLNLIFPYIELKERLEINEISKELKINYEKLKEANELNSVLLKQGLMYSTKMLKIITGEGKGTYGKSGTINKSNYRLINKSV